MRKIHILFCLSFFLIFGCLEDEGNYDYDDIKEPKWHTDQPISVYATEHNVMKLRGHDAFRWDTDSVSREREVRYEWKLNDVVIATEADIDIPVDSVIKWTKMEELCATDKWVRGSFTVIDKEFETHFMKVVSFFITPYRSNGDWFVLTEKEGEGECYFVKRTYNREESKDEFELQDSFSEINALSISGKPVFLGYTRTAKNVGPMGSITIIPLFSMLAAYLYTDTYTKNIEQVEYLVPQGKKHEIILPDGSHVYLNAGTLLVYPKKFIGKMRTVYLMGEGNFHVKKDQKHPFIVKTSSLKIKVLGTKFNVCAYGNEDKTVTTLESGSVMIQKPTEEPITVLSPNEQLEYHNTTGEFQKRKIDASIYSGWTKGELNFVSQSLKEIVKSLERTY